MATTSGFLMCVQVCTCTHVHTHTHFQEMGLEQGLSNNNSEGKSSPLPIL